MSARNIDIILAVLTGRSARLDIRSEGLRVLPRSERAPVAEAVSAALKAAPLKRGAHVLVLSSDFFTQAVRLPALQTSGLPHEDLLSALLFEVEPFSNISRQQGRAAFAAVEESAGIITWQVLQIATGDSADIGAAIRAAGGKAAGFAPAGDALVSAGELELAGLLKAAAADAASPSSKLPFIAPAATGLAANRLSAAGGALIAATAIACLVHAAAANARCDRVRARVTALDGLEAVNAQTAAAVRTLEAQVAALEKVRDDRAAGEKDLARYRAAWQVLIQNLPQACGSDVVLRSLESTAPFDAVLEGSSATEKGPGDCLSALAQSAGQAGWRIFPELLRRAPAAGGSALLRFRFRASLEPRAAAPGKQPSSRAAPPASGAGTSADAWRHDL